MPVKAIDETPPPFSPTAPASRKEHLPLQGFEDSSVSHAQANQSQYRPSKPSLDPPTNPIYQTIEYLNSRTENVYAKWMQMRGSNIEKQFEKIHEMQVEHGKQMDEALEASKKVSFWGILEDLFSTLSGAAAFFFGTTAALAGSPILGGILIASGVLSVGNLAFKHGRIWDWTADQIAGSNKKLRDQIRSYLPCAVSLAATALAMAGSWGAWKYATQTGYQMTSHLMKTSADTLDGLVKYKSGAAYSLQKGVLAGLGALQTKADLSRMGLENLIEDVQEFHQHQTDMHATIGKILEEQDQAMQVVQQPV